MVRDGARAPPHHGGLHRNNSHPSLPGLTRRSSS